MAGGSQRDRVIAACAAKPFFTPRGGHDRVGVLLTGTTDWAEIRELITDSYRGLAPKKLIALLGE